MYEYNPKAFDRHIKDKTFSQRSLSESTNTSRPTIIRWIHGEDIYVSKLLRICNSFKIPLGDFIRENDIPISTFFTDSKEQTETLHTSSKEQSVNVAEIMKYEEQMKKIKDEYEDRINRIEKDFLERIGDVREASAEKWAKKNMEALQSERKALESKYERKLKDQSEEIIRLREENAVLKSKLSGNYLRTHIPSDRLSEDNPHDAKL